ncbi:MAG: SDR family NAD(P)-dependent oxidoreductase [bacterium]
MRLEGKVGIVTGGSGGIGRAIARALASEGAAIAVASNEESPLNDTVEELRSGGFEVMGIFCDLTSAPQVSDMVAHTLKAFGQIDILVNSAGVLVKKPVLEITEEEWDLVINVNLKGVFLASREVARWMVRERRRGKIINIASMTSFVALPQVAAYCASKGGVLQLTKAFAVDLAPYGINVNAIAPGFFKTRLNERAFAEDPERLAKIVSSTPMGRVGRVEDLAGAAIFLASGESDFITGAALPVDGGFLASGF